MKTAGLASCRSALAAPYSRLLPVGTRAQEGYFARLTARETPSQPAHGLRRRISSVRAGKTTVGRSAKPKHHDRHAGLSKRGRHLFCLLDWKHRVSIAVKDEVRRVVSGHVRDR